MNYTDNFFSFPVKIFSAHTIQKALKQEEIVDEELQIDYLVGRASVLPRNIYSWCDAFSRGTSLEDVKENGFDCCLIETSAGPYMCTWERQKFEDKLNAFINKLEKDMEEDRRQQIIDQIRNQIKIKIQDDEITEIKPTDTEEEA